VYAAPADSDQLLCLDAQTGRTLWERERLDVVDLLGVGQGRLIFSTRSGLRAVGAANGSDRDGWVLPDSGGALPPMGRGLLIGDLVLFSTDRVPWGVFAVRQRDGRQPDANDPALLHRIPSGNLVYADGCLVVAGRRTLSVFVPPRDLEAHAGRPSTASLLDLGRAEARAGRRKEADSWDFPPPARLQALLQAAQTQQDTGAPAQAVLAWQAILDSEDLRGIPVYDCAGLPAPAGARAVGAIAALRGRYGEKVYASVERRAQELWAEAPEKERAVVAERLALEFPNAAVTGTALLYLARQHEKARHPGAAAHAYRRLLASGATDPERALAREGLARAHEQEGCREADRKGTSGPSLPLLRAWQVDLRPGERLLAGAEGANIPGWLWGSRSREDGQRGGELVARDGATGKERWACRLPFVPVWLGCYLDLVLAGGEEGVAGLRREDGQRVWDFPAPVLSRYLGGTDGLRVLTEGESPGPLGGFQLAAGRLLLLQGGRRLLALEAETGKALWQSWAPGAVFQQPVPWGRFYSRYHAGAGTVLVQTASGRRWLVAADRGTLICDAPDSAEPWPEMPLALDGETLCVVREARDVVLLEARTGRERWTHRAAGVGGLSGEPVHVLGAGSTLLVVTATNLGYEVQRLDLNTGQPCLRGPVRLNLHSFDRAAWALDAGAVYLARGQRLGAWSLGDGKPLWERSLDGVKEWRVARQGDMVLAYPARMPQVRFSFRWLFGSVQWTSGFPREVGARRFFTVVCCDPKTGQLVQRLNFLGERDRLTAGVDPSPKITVLPRVEAWRGLAPEREAAMQVSGSLLVVARAGQAWGLTCPRYAGR
jgi:outer membrane protein assembly factor BamB